MGQLVNVENRVDESLKIAKYNVMLRFMMPVMMPVMIVTFW